MVPSALCGFQCLKRIFYLEKNMKITGVEFENSSTCRGVGFAERGAPLDLAHISIRGRYPENGWAMNDIIHEMGWIASGRGSLMIKGGDAQPLQKGDVVLIKPKESFAWEGEMDIIIACSPPFDSQQYNIEETAA
jgi:mannose-6-phosphate isomerase-like protein (cupin superfamily)